MTERPRASGKHFPAGTVTDGQGGTVTLKLVSWKIPVRYMRIWMTESPNTCDTHGESDKRNCVGYAINELYAGTLAPDGQFTDVVKHLPSRKQTVTWPSSVDPWHAATDLDESKGDQVGFDFFFSSGVTRGLPAMIPIAMLYYTPERCRRRDRLSLQAPLSDSHGSKWARNPMVRTCCPKTTARSICNSRRRIHRLASGSQTGRTVVSRA